MIPAEYKNVLTNPVIAGIGSWIHDTTDAIISGYPIPVKAGARATDHAVINGIAIDEMAVISIVSGKNRTFRQSVNPVLIQTGIIGLHGLHPVPILIQPPDAMHGGNNADPIFTTLIRFMQAPDRMSIIFPKFIIPDII